MKALIMTFGLALSFFVAAAVFAFTNVPLFTRSEHVAICMITGAFFLLAGILLIERYYLHTRLAK